MSRYKEYSGVETLVAILNVLSHPDAETDVLDVKPLFKKIAQAFDEMVELAAEARDMAEQVGQVDRLVAENEGLRDSLRLAEEEIQKLRAKID